MGEDTWQRPPAQMLGCFAVTLLYTSMCHILVLSTAEMTGLGEILLLLFVSFTTGTWV
jgi:hypothetical protein